MKKNIVKTLSTVFILTAISKVLGFIRDIVFAQIYGTGQEATAFQAALKIPTQIVDIVLSSAIVSCFIPVFNEILQKDGKDKANKFAGNFVRIVSIIATSISIIGMIFAPSIVKTFTDFTPETYSLTVNLVRITFPMIIFTALAFSFVGFLQSYGEFNVPASISGISNLVVILFLLIFNNKLGIQGVCYCMVLAWILQLVVQIPFAKKFGFDFKLKVDFKDQNIKKVFKLAVPILISTAVLPINNLVSMKFASGIGDMYYSALEYAYKLYVVVYGIFSYAIGNIIFPELSKAISANDKEGYSKTIVKSLRLISFLLIPLTCGIMIYSKDIVQLAYERGNFTAESTMLTSGALFFYAIGIIGAGIVEIMNKAFYAKQNIKTPLIVGFCVIAINFILCATLSKTSLAHTGIALATAISSFVNAAILFTIICKEHTEILSKELIANFLKIIIATLVMCFVVYGSNYLLVSFNTGFIQNLLRVSIGTLLGVTIYFAFTFVLKANEFIKQGLKEKE